MNPTLTQPRQPTGEVPPRIEGYPRAASRWWRAAALGILGTVGLLLYFFNPAEHRFYPLCWFTHVTGLLCPGCGGLRATHQLLHGHVLEALRLNALFVVSLPLLLIYVWRRFRQRQQPATAPTHRSDAWLWTALGVLVLFGVLRNLPGLDLLRP